MQPVKHVVERVCSKAKNCIRGYKYCRYGIQNWNRSFSPKTYQKWSTTEILKP